MAPAFGGTSAHGVVNDHVLLRKGLTLRVRERERERERRERERDRERVLVAILAQGLKLQVLQQISPHGTSRRAISGLKLQALAADFSACQK